MRHCIGRLLLLSTYEQVAAVERSARDRPYHESVCDRVSGTAVAAGAWTVCRQPKMQSALRVMVFSGK
jgi:hypothetical protein